MRSDSSDSERAPARSVENYEPAPNAATRILVIEDNSDAAEILELWLRTFGHDVRIANSGEEGVTIAADWQPDIVFSDISLPGQTDGYAVARALRASSGRAAFLVALSGYGSARAKTEARDAGFDAYVTKPIDASDLNRLLTEATTRAAAARRDSPLSSS